MSTGQKSPSETLYSWTRSQRWRPVTWLMIIAGLLHLVGDIAAVVSGIATHRDPFVLVLASIAHRLGYTLSFFGTAAIVEYLARIWDELRLARRPPDPSPPAGEGGRAAAG